MGQDRRQVHGADRGIDRGRLNDCDLLLAKRFADDVQSARERGVSKRPGPLPWLVGRDRGDERLFWVDELGLSLGRAAARAAIDSLDRCMDALLFQQIEADGA